MESKLSTISLTEPLGISTRHSDTDVCILQGMNVGTSKCYRHSCGKQAIQDEFLCCFLYLKAGNILCEFPDNRLNSSRDCAFYFLCVSGLLYIQAVVSLLWLSERSYDGNSRIPVHCKDISRYGIACWDFGLFKITSHDKCISRIVSWNVCGSMAVKVILYIAMSFHERERAVKDTKIRGLFQKNASLLA